MAKDLFCPICNIDVCSRNRTTFLFCPTFVVFTLPIRFLREYRCQQPRGLTLLEGSGGGK